VADFTPPEIFAEKWRFMILKLYTTKTDSSPKMPDFGSPNFLGGLKA
jgi:hypothetical protein